jgi:hypothetical protein
VKPNADAYRRREFLSTTVLPLSVLGPVVLAASSARAASQQSFDIVVNDADGILGRLQAPVSVVTALSIEQRRAAAEGRLQFTEKRDAPARQRPPSPAQLLTGSDIAPEAQLAWHMPPGPSGKRMFQLEEALRPTAPAMLVARDTRSGQCDIIESAKPVLRYNYATVEPGDILKSIAPGNLIYARARSDYVHPLFGPSGEMLTKDWSKDHPHHRGIYWAWPEVDWRGRRGDLHALQHVFARPTGRCQLTSGPVFAQIDAENVWKWEDNDEIVRERVVIRVWRAMPQGRLIDLEFHFNALNDPVSLARRGTDQYGGLNIRLAAVRDQKISFHTDPPVASPRAAWGRLSGTYEGASEPATFAVLQHPGNRDHPGDWVEYPNLNWLQPTFPASGSRFVLKKGEPLVLRYRLWIVSGLAEDEACADQCRAYHSIRFW